MNLTHLVSIALLFLFFLNTLTAASNNNPTHAYADVSIDCGSTKTSAASNGKEWLGDAQPQHSSLLQIKGSSITSTIKSISVDPIPYKTARASRSQFSYSFKVNPGQKIIRLHFNPTPYKGFKKYKDLFTVEVSPFTLLSNFSASITADALGLKSFVKEFCINIAENQTLNINFSPENSQSQDNTYAFINGIEIISVPASLSYFHDIDIGVQVVGKSRVYIGYTTALEIIHRQNFKQSSVLPSGDFDDDLFPMWAMRKANKIKNDTWKIPVDVGFKYLVRLHFSEIGLKLAETRDKVIFKVLINEMIAHTNIDINKERDDDNDSIVWYRDYIVMMCGQNKKEVKRDLSISMQSYDETIDGHGLLAGFEILKLSNPDNSVASPNPLPKRQDSPSRFLQTLLSGLGQRNTIATVAITILAMVSVMVHILRQIWESSSTEEENKPSARAERFCRHFSLSEIQLATRNFSDALIIGKGGFGLVYKGFIGNGLGIVAIKRLKSTSRQGAHEFLTEIETLSELRHANLVSLIGYCNEQREMILVYEYLAFGTLADHLYKLARHNNNFTSLTWKQRVDICIGAGRGLDYLHTGHRLIHRDVKASNILLDKNYLAKVSDFGLAKPEDRNKLQSHVSTKVKGTPGYFDPYYLSTSKLTRKSDTYAFGVVLLEVLCGRPALDSRVAEDERILTKWARDNISKGEVDRIVASSLREEISPDSLKTFVGIAERCLHDEPKRRPTMAQVVLQLEFALEQHESKSNDLTSVSDEIHPCNDETNLSANTGQPTMVSTDVHNLTTPRKEQTNSKVVNAELPSGRKANFNKPSRLWPWDTFWTRVKPSKKNDLLLSEICEANVTLPKFDWATAVAATDQFSSSNKVGQGGFGSVYKAVLATGQLVAVKRFSQTSSIEKFKNEILLLPNLRHRNIIKLLGYCIHREEKLLVYEFMGNRSLDTVVTEKAQRQELEWTLRLRIIKGIARAVVYLHQDSGLKVIHRDLKPSNILLDDELNPKLSGFAIARTLGENQSEMESRIAGTLGYICPEYLSGGTVSVGLDVYSFGVTILQIMSGRRTIHHTPNLEEMPFLNNARKLWDEGNALDLVDESLGGEFLDEEALRCIQIGLLCTQEKAHRPVMASVLKMLEGEELLMEPNERRSVYDDIDPCGTHVDLRKFDWTTIAKATNNFFHRIEEGGFGSFYKAVLPTGQTVAVKRISPYSRTGQNEFEQQVQLLPQLRHPNIITLLGYCIHGEERILVYEFMKNGRLKTLLIDEANRDRMKWAVRFKIVMGIARGLLYLHQDSGLTIIHTRLTPSNIFLDTKMNPKVAGITQSFGYQSEHITTDVAAQKGYTSPEYALYGQFSVKSDVYSFGIIVLEIISGRRTRQHKLNQEPMCLLNYAWNLWNEKKALDLVDKSVRGAFPVDEALRCIQVGLLCTQYEPNDRPEMPSVLKMLEGEDLLVEPKEPWPGGVDLACRRSVHTSGLDSDASSDHLDKTQR